MLVVQHYFIFVLFEELKILCLQIMHLSHLSSKMSWKIRCCPLLRSILSSGCEKDEGLASLLGIWQYSFPVSGSPIFFIPKFLSHPSSPVRDQLVPLMGRADDISISAFCCCVLCQKNEQRAWPLSWRKVKYRIFQIIASICLSAMVTRTLDTNPMLESDNKYCKRLEYG